MAQLSLIALSVLFIGVQADLFGVFNNLVQDPSGLGKLLTFGDSNLLHSYSQHLAKHNKTLKNAEEIIKRAGIFKANQQKIQESQKKERGNAKHACTKFCDLSLEEFLKTSTGFKSSTKKLANKGPGAPKRPAKLSGGRVKRDDEIPDSFDWRDYGFVSSVKDQGSCGVCVSFTSAAVAESVYALTYDTTPGDYSEEELLSCAPGSNQCDGSSFDKEFDYIHSKGGVVSEDSDPYNADGDHSCNVDENADRQADVNYYFTSSSEDEIKENIYWYGPMGVAIDASPLQSYDGGILDADEPDGGWGINHAVTLIGYGSEDGNDYWIAKNSWSDGWGEEGFFRMARGKNMLNVLHEPVAVTVA